MYQKPTDKKYLILNCNNIRTIRILLVLTKIPLLFHNNHFRQYVEDKVKKYYFLIVLKALLKSIKWPYTQNYVLVLKILKYFGLNRKILLIGC